MSEKFTLNIAGTEMHIVSEDEESYVIELAHELDESINGIIINNTRCSKMEASLLCALNLLDSKLKLADENEDLRRELSQLKRKYGRI